MQSIIPGASGGLRDLALILDILQNKDKYEPKMKAFAKAKADAEAMAKEARVLFDEAKKAAERNTMTEAALASLEADLRSRETGVSVREARIAAAEEAHRKEVTRLADEFAARENALKPKETELARREKRVAELERKAEASAEAAGALEKELQVKMSKFRELAK